MLSLSAFPFSSKIVMRSMAVMAEYKLGTVVVNFVKDTPELAAAVGKEECAHTDNAHPQAQKRTIMLHLPLPLARTGSVAVA